MSIMLLWFAKLLLLFSQAFNLGAGSTWPGHILLSLTPRFLKEFDKKFTGKIIVVAGTNGKTTTSRLIRTILEESGKSVIHNESGANLLNGIASAIIGATSWNGTLPDTAIFEIDENSLPLFLKELTPDILVILNLFRDQLDRYGEVNTILLKWQNSLSKLSKETQLLLNADDPFIAYLGKSTAAVVSFFGISDKTLFLRDKPYAMDASFCPECTGKLTFEGIYLGHLGIWQCKSCGLSRPAVVFESAQTVLPGVYNIYNVEAALLVARKLGIDGKTVDKAFSHFKPAFGRQEEFVVDGKKVKIFLSKNPTGFNESLRTIKELKAKHLLLVLNDRIPDGRDVSWIWDVDFEEFLDSNMSVTVSGDRVYDMALRLKYANSPKTQNSNVKTQIHNSKVKTYENLREAIEESLKILSKKEVLYILPTYSAMLEVRKILGGRKIL